MQIVVYNKAWARVGAIQAVTAIAGQELENGISVLQFTVDGDVSYAQAAASAGARFELYDGNDLIGGYELDEVTMTIPSRLSMVSVKAVGYAAVLDRLLGQPEPTRVIPLEETYQFPVEYDHRSGPFETVVKGLVFDAAQRIGEPLTVVPTQGRGPVVTVDVRNHNLADTLWPLADRYGMSIRVGPNATSTGYLLDVVPRTEPRGIFVDGPGPLQAGVLTLRRPTAHIVVFGGPGEGVDRQFWQAAATDTRVQDWGVRGEVFRDARDVRDQGVFERRWAQALEETGPSYGLTLELAEVDGFRWRRGYDVGQKVSVQVGDTVYTDWVRRVEWEWRPGRGPGTGFSAKPIVGDHKGTATTDLVASVAAIQRTDRIGKADT